MPRLIYGVLSLILGAMALLLPETKKFPLPRTMMQVEMIPTTISQHCRRRRLRASKRTYPADGAHGDGGRSLAERNSTISVLPLNRPSANQSTVHSFYEMQEYGSEDPNNRNLVRRNPAALQSPNVNNYYTQKPQAIAEDVESDDDEIDEHQPRLVYAEERPQRGPPKTSITHNDDDVIVSPVMRRTTSDSRHSTSETPTQLEVTAQIQAGDVIVDPNESKEKHDETSKTSEFQRTMSEENYFSEHS